MTATNDADPAGRRAMLSTLRRCVMQLAGAAVLLMRPPIRPRLSWVGSPEKLAAGIAAFGLALLCGMVFIDAETINAVLRLPRWIVACFNSITDFGRSGWFLWPLGILFLLLASLPPILSRFSQLVLATIMVRVGFLFVAIGAPGLFVTTIKRMIGRARPMVMGHVDPFVFRPFIWRPEYASLPSGHATTAFSVLVALGALWPRGRNVLVIYALSIAASRVIVVAHYPTDVFAGAVIGALGALMVRRWFALRRLGFSVGSDGRILPYPGPSLKRIKSVARQLLAE
jgi:membrane-associated phospholipid phosphatase